MSSNLISSDGPLTPAQAAALRRIFSSMIPASSEYNVPAADDERIFADILSTGRNTLPLVAASLQQMTEQACWQDQLDSENPEEDPAVTWYRQAHPQFTSLLVGLAVQCYYRDDRVMASLQMEARPPFPQGYEIADGDWSLLDPVRRRGRIYRQVPE